MKKLIALSFILISLSASSQFLSGFGVMGGITYSRQKWHAFIPEEITLKKKNILRYNACIFAEFFSHPNFRWVSELQYNMKGTIEVLPDNSKFRNKTDYLSFNNYLKVRFETYRGYPYFLIGPRAEYLFKTSPEIYPEIITDFEKIHFGWSAGIGFEFMSYGPLKFLTEVHYNPDFTNAYERDILDITNRGLELRIGLKFVPQSAGEKCPPALH
jgi:hypothetical protein